jgi:hypothetical protein
VGLGVQHVAFFTGTLETSFGVVAHLRACTKDLTLIDILACFVVSLQLESVSAGAVRSIIVELAFVGTAKLVCCSTRICLVAEVEGFIFSLTTVIALVADFVQTNAVLAILCAVKLSF